MVHTIWTILNDELLNKPVLQYSRTQEPLLKNVHLSLKDVHMDLKSGSMKLKLARGTNFGEKSSFLTIRTMSDEKPTFQNFIGFLVGYRC